MVIPKKCSHCRYGSGELGFATQPATGLKKITLPPTGIFMEDEAVNLWDELEVVVMEMTEMSPEMGVLIENTQILLEGYIPPRTARKRAAKGLYGWGRKLRCQG